MYVVKEGNQTFVGYDKADAEARRDRAIHRQAHLEAAYPLASRYVKNGNYEAAQRIIEGVFGNP